MRAAAPTHRIGTEGGTMSEQHNYRRPAWRCLACDEPWPCAARRGQFLAKFTAEDAGMSGKARLRSILGAIVLDFEKDQPGVPKGEVYTRFVSWTFEPTVPRVPGGARRHPGFKS